MQNEYITIDGFENLSEQEIFDISLTHVRKNGTPSVTFRHGTFGCIYSGIGCAAAPFIKLEYRETADDTGGAWGELLQNKMVPNNNFIFMSKIQNAHDSAAVTKMDGEKFIKLFNSDMFQISRNYNLKYTD